MWQRLSYVGNVALVIALAGALYSNTRTSSQVREAEAFPRKVAEQHAEWQAKKQALDDEYRRKEAAVQARIDALEAQIRELERKGTGK